MSKKQLAQLSTRLCACEKSILSSALKISHQNCEQFLEQFSAHANRRLKALLKSVISPTCSVRLSYAVSQYRSRPSFGSALSICSLRKRHRSLCLLPFVGGRHPRLPFYSHFCFPLYRCMQLAVACSADISHLNTLTGRDSFPYGSRPSAALTVCFLF